VENRLNNVASLMVKIWKNMLEGTGEPFRLSCTYNTTILQKVLNIAKSAIITKERVLTWQFVLHVAVSILLMVNTVKSVLGNINWHIIGIILETKI
jgi:hypothetical protein